MIHELIEVYGDFEHASLQVNFNLLPHDEALRSLKLFCEEVAPEFMTEPQKMAESA